MRKHANVPARLLAPLAAMTVLMGLAACYTEAPPTSTVTRTETTRTTTTPSYVTTTPGYVTTTPLPPVTAGTSSTTTTTVEPPQ